MITFLGFTVNNKPSVVISLQMSSDMFLTSFVTFSFTSVLFFYFADIRNTTTCWNPSRLRIIHLCFFLGDLRSSNWKILSFTNWLQKL